MGSGHGRSYSTALNLFAEVLLLPKKIPGFEKLLERDNEECHQPNWKDLNRYSFLFNFFVYCSSRLNRTKISDL